MSKARLALIPLALSAALGIAATRAEAQAPDHAAIDIAAIEDSVAVMKQRSAAAQAALAAVQQRARSVPDDSLTLSGSVVLITAADVPESERRRMARAFATVETQLRDLLGPDGPSLLAETRWHLMVTPRGGRFSRPMVALAPLLRGDSANAERMGTAVLGFPLNETYLTQLVLNGAGQRLLARHPALTRWLGPSILMRDADEAYYTTSRELAVRGTVRARRCLEGSIDDCAIILDPARLNDWFVPEDSARMRPPSPGVRASVLFFTIEAAGPRLLPTLATAPDSTPPLALLAQVAGLTPEALVTQWQAAIADGGRTRAGVAPRLALSSLAWLILFGFVATRRRPR